MTQLTPDAMVNHSASNVLLSNKPGATDVEGPGASKRTPMLSIGLFVYNGERFIEQALKSLVNQTYRDFELIVSDNGSTDKTAAICQRYADADPRIRFYRADRNMGAGWNLRRVYELATGKYFKWAACDDICDLDYMRQCIEALENDPGLVCAYSKTKVIDENGKFLEYYEWPLRTDSADTVTRWRDLLLNDHMCYQIFGVFRLETLRRLPPQGSFVNSDGVLLAEVSLYGRFHEIPEYLFTSTRHSGQSSKTLPERLKVKKRRFRLTNRFGTLPCPEWWDPNKKKTITFPEWRMLREYWQALGRSPLRGRERLKSYALLVPWIKRHFRRMMKDLLIAADQVLYNIQMSRYSATDLSTAGGRSA